MQCVESKSEWKKKTAYGAGRMPNRRAYRTQTLFQFFLFGTLVTYSRHNGKCNICAFHEEIRAVEDWIFDRFMTSESRDTLILPFTSKTGQSVGKRSFIWVLLVNRGDILSFYRHNFRLQTNRVLEIELNEQELLPFLIDFYLGIPDTNSRHPRLTLSPFSPLPKL